jgi:hypothetical protein
MSGFDISEDLEELSNIRDCIERFIKHRWGLNSRAKSKINYNRSVLDWEVLKVSQAKLITITPCAASEGLFMRGLNAFNMLCDRPFAGFVVPSVIGTLYGTIGMMD